MADVIQQGWERYLYCLQRYPLRTKSITAGVLAGSSDCLAQKLGGAKSLQYRRAVFMALYGLIYAGPFGHYWHKLMDRIFAGKNDSGTVVKKVVVEQLTSNPWNNLLYMSYIGLVLEGRTWASLKKKLQTDFFGLQLNSWRFWPIIGLINYRYVPLQLRVLFVNLAAVCCNCTVASSYGYSCFNLTDQKARIYERAVRNLLRVKYFCEGERANYLKWRVLSSGARVSFSIPKAGTKPDLSKAL